MTDEKPQKGIVAFTIDTESVGIGTIQRHLVRTLACEVIRTFLEAADALEDADLSTVLTATHEALELLAELSEKEQHEQRSD